MRDFFGADIIRVCFSAFSAFVIASEFLNQASS